ncbi:Lrp/AsnC family transcriptional regulator [Variovorax sp. PAMC 28711]|uniref:Lrp/AsnC family transcriptional regulator n=1 Tax=Variovorax sp. PAMC 28711 TaxID=1795631 RepID=UPI00078E3934|nr:Lrp/AsnC family transcriptional regulator [Variovorax sp. PAMC 28711]AMM26629.1 AsnC family transcriptional regulator [Variovorax sp. PAMC 28711]
MESFSLDAVDLSLLDALQRDASRTNQQLAADTGISPPTCLRRLQRLRAAGLIERQIALLAPDKLASLLGHGLQAVVEISLDRQDSAALDAFELRVNADDAVQQCYRVSPGPDFVLIVVAHDMPGYLALAQRLFTVDANVRNVKTFFSVKRSKFAPSVPLTPSASSEAATSWGC